MLEVFPSVGDLVLAIVPGWEPADEARSSRQTVRVACRVARIKALLQGADFDFPWLRNLVHSMSEVRMLGPSEGPSPSGTVRIG